jgi:hypothetical protein
MFTRRLPLFVSVTVAVVLTAPTATAEKLTELGLGVTVA